MSSAVQETRQPNHMTRRVLERRQNTALARAGTHPKHIQPRKWGRKSDATRVDDHHPASPCHRGLLATENTRCHRKLSSLSHGHVRVPSGPLCISLENHRVAHGDYPRRSGHPCPHACKRLRRRPIDFPPNPASVRPYTPRFLRRRTKTPLWYQ